MNGSKLISQTHELGQKRVYGKESYINFFMIAQVFILLFNKIEKFK